MLVSRTSNLEVTENSPFLVHNEKKHFVFQHSGFVICRDLRCTGDWMALHNLQWTSKVCAALPICTTVLKVASESKFPEVRTAVALGAKNIANIIEANEIIDSLKQDADNAVRIHSLEADGACNKRY